MTQTMPLWGRYRGDAINLHQLCPGARAPERIARSGSPGQQHPRPARRAGHSERLCAVEVVSIQAVFHRFQHLEADLVIHVKSGRR
jgi:hypothetical protein